MSISEENFLIGQCFIYIYVLGIDVIGLLVDDLDVCILNFDVINLFFQFCIDSLGSIIIDNLIIEMVVDVVDVL